MQGLHRYKNISISDQNIFEDTFTSEIVVHFASSSHLDAEILGKSIVFAQFATANRLHPSYLKNQTVCETFDSFYETIIESLNVRREGIKDQKLESKHDFHNFQTILMDWKRELDLI